MAMSHHQILFNNYMYIYNSFYYPKYLCIFMCICVPMPPHEQDVTQDQFVTVFKRCEFRVFLLLDQTWYQGKIAQSSQQVTHSWRKNSWMHTFPMMFRPFEMQNAAFRYWIRITVPICSDDSHYITSASPPSLSLYIYIYIYIYIYNSWEEWYIRVQHFNKDLNR